MAVHGDSMVDVHADELPTTKGKLFAKYPSRHAQSLDFVSQSFVNTSCLVVDVSFLLVL